MNLRAYKRQLVATLALGLLPRPRATAIEVATPVTIGQNPTRPADAVDVQREGPRPREGAGKDAATSTRCA